MADWNVRPAGAGAGGGGTWGCDGADEGPAELVKADGETADVGLLEDALLSFVARFRILVRGCCSAWAFLPRLVKGKLARPISCECSETSGRKESLSSSYMHSAFPLTACTDLITIEVCFVTY